MLVKDDSINVEKLFVKSIKLINSLFKLKAKISLTHKFFILKQFIYQKIRCQTISFS